MTGSATGVTATRISGTYSGTTTCTGGFNPGPLNNGQFTLMKQQGTLITSDSSAVDGHPREFSERDVLAITERQGGAKKGVLVGLGVVAISSSVLGVASQNYRFSTTGEATT